MKLLKIFFLFTFFCFNLSAKECASKYSALIFDAKNNHILFEKRADNYVYPASLTKVMMLYLVFEALENGKLHLDQKIKISAYAQDVSAVNKITSLHLREGEEISVLQAIRGSAIKSFNETALALAEAVGGDEWQFVKMMNEKAEKLQMFHTNFRNSTGFHEEGQYSTAQDMARLLIAIEKKFPQYIKYFGQKEFKYDGIDYVTHNHFLLDYKGATGFKTGFTSKAGFNLMASAKREHDEINGVLMACESFRARDKFMKEKFDEAFAYKAEEHEEEMKIYLKTVF